MNDEQIAEFLSGLPVERLVSILRTVFDVTHPAPAEAAHCRSRFFLGAAWSHLDSDNGEPDRWGPWELEAVAYVDPAEYGDGLGPDYGLCQEGTCQVCGTRVRSNVKHGLCSICGGPAHMT